MQNIATIHDIAFVAELHEVDCDGRPFRRAVKLGDTVRIHRGAYMSAALWRNLEPRERYRHQVIAAAGASKTHPVLSHRSAAVVWGLPLIGTLPQLVDVLSSKKAGTSKDSSFHRHATRFLHSEIEFVDGVSITSLRRTVIDLALMVPFSAAVAAVDWALSPGTGSNPKPSLSPEELFETVDALRPSGGARRAHRAIEFGDGRSGSAGESISRAVIHELKLPAPVLQKRFEDRLGVIGCTDFWWPDFGLMGEFDGAVKYLREGVPNGRSITDTVLAEKKREERLRALGPSMVRWLWPHALDPKSLLGLLRAAGLPAPRWGR